MKSLRCCLLLALLLASIAWPASAQTRTGMLVTTEWLARRLNDPKVIVLHIAADAKHYTDGHIPGARLVLLKDLTVTRQGIPNELPPVSDLQKLFESVGVGAEAKLVLYGDNLLLSAARAYYTLDYLGHGDRAALLDGGLEKWKAEKRATSTQAVKPEPAQFTPRVRPQTKVELTAMRDLSWVAANVAAPNVTIIDARPAAQYEGQEAGGGVPRGGHIPGAISLYWQQHLLSVENPALKPVAELRKLFARAGAQPGQHIVTYCRSGVQASHSYFVAKYLGYDVAMYDGSFLEWSNTEGAPVASGKERK